VHVDDVLRSCLLVQVVHVLRAEEKAISQLLLQLRKSDVSRVATAATRRRIE
jgi:hypothetical protein